MGEVYRARDTRLGRDVALKILPPEHAGDPDRLRRFEREARAVAALDHPHILALHDLGSENGLSYVVFELLKAETLRQRLLRGPVPVRKCVEWGGQICRGLAAAHAQGIIHRDLKPENLGLTSEGRIKILDFGLAKLTEASASEAEATTLTASDPGGVVGTAGYVSPEQLRDHPADARSDVFAFGAVLYELLAGHPAFGGDTRADRHSAVLHHDPPELASASREPVPPGLERIVRRCLEKDPEERFQSARDVAFALDALGDPSARDSIAKPLRHPGRRAVRIAGAALALVGAAVVGLLAGRTLVEYRPPAVRQLSFQRGAITGARFAPDERTVVYSACWEGRPNDIILTRLDGPESRSLGLPPAKILSVSSRGELAILLTKPDEVGDPFLGTLARVALAGGSPRPLLEDVEDADWSPDGQTLAVVRRVGGERQLEYPLGNVLWRPIVSEQANTHGMRVSPRGDRVALVAHPFLMIVDRSGARQALALPAAGATGIAWEPRGDAVWATAGETDHNKGVLRLGLDGSRRELYHGLGSPVLHDVSRSGAALLHQGYERGGVRVKLRGEATERELAGLSPASGAVDISPDGSQVIVGDQFKQGYYLHHVRGGDPVFLTHAQGPARLSPDGQWLLVGPSRGETTAKLVPIGPGEPRDLAVGKLQDSSFSFLDADHVYWRASEAGASSRRAFVQDIKTGALRPVMPEGVDPYWSPVVEGALLGQRADGTLVWYPLDRGSPRPTAARLPGKEVSLNTTPDGRWTFVNSGGLPVRIERIDLRTGRRELWRSLAPPDLAGVVMMGWPWISMAPDGEAYAYNYLRVSQDLYLMEGLR